MIPKHQTTKFRGSGHRQEHSTSSALKQMPCDHGSKVIRTDPMPWMRNAIRISLLQSELS